MIRIINLDDVSYAKNGKIILDKVSFEIEKGSFVSIVGSNGSGKSTLVKIFAGLINYSGYININGSVLERNTIREIKKNVGIVLSDMDNFLIGNTVSDEFAIALDNNGFDRDVSIKKIKDMVEEFNLHNIIEEDVRNLSNSDKEMVSILSALITNPDIIILDDCMHQLSCYSKEKIFNLLMKYKKKYKLTIIMITHDVEDVVNSDRVMVMDKGKIVMDGSAVHVFKNKEMLKKYGVGVPFSIDLSLKLKEKGVLNHVYLDMGKLVDNIWK